MTEPPSPLTAHQHVALMWCESPAVLEELCRSLDLSALAIERVGSQGLVVPTPQLDALTRMLHERGIFPRVIGQAPTRDEDEEEDAP